MSKKQNPSRKVKLKNNINRTIPASHIKKKAFDSDTKIEYDINKRNDTFTRTIGENKFKEFTTTSSTYGNFANAPNKTKLCTISERKINDFFKCFVGKTLDSNKEANNQSDYKSNQNDINMQKSIEAGNHLKNKILQVCIKKGWLGLSKFKNYLYNLSNKKIYMHIEDTKKFFVNFGICLEERELEYMINNYLNSSNEINYNALINSLIQCSDERINMINVLLNEIKSINGCLCKDNIIKMLNPDIHPDVINFRITDKELIRDYSDLFNDFVSDELFIQIFKEISTCIIDDELFKAILISCGFQQ